jgi:hypothetical protein
MSKGTIWVHDDYEDFLVSYKKRLEGLKLVTRRFEVRQMRSQELRREIDILSERQRLLREQPTGDPLAHGDSKLDSASIFIIDYDLVKEAWGPSFVTAENLSYPVRCFSKCGLIVALNQYTRETARNTFNLTLREDLDSWADLNIDSAQLDNPGLWGGKARGFRPWHWPQLPDWLDSFEKRVADVVDHPNDHIYEVLEIPKDVIPLLARPAGSFIGREPANMGFGEFVEKSGNGLRGRDRHATTDMIARISAARIAVWLERRVLPGQNILVDAPHLVSRYPSLLKGGHSKIATWDNVTRFDTYDKLGLDHAKIERARFKKVHWLSRPAWFWNKVSSIQAIREVSKPWKGESTSYAFCEDASTFHRMKESQEFKAELDSPYVLRSIRGFDDITYLPTSGLVT